MFKHNRLLFKGIRSVSLIKINTRSLMFTPHPADFNVRKSIKWYWREVNYDMADGERYKNYTIRRNDDKLELIPKEYDSCLIWLYDGDWVDMFVETLLEYNNFPPKNFKIVFYFAKFNPVQFDSAILSRNWFNIFELPDQSGYRSGLKQSVIHKYNSLIQREIKDQYNLIGDHKKIFIGGFSQSGCMALHAGLTCEKNMGGIISFAGFNFDFNPLDSEKKSIPMLFINGTNDETVIVRQARQSYENLIKKGFSVNYIEEPGLYHNFSQSGLVKANNLLCNKKI